MSYSCTRIACNIYVIDDGKSIFGAFKIATDNDRNNCNKHEQYMYNLVSDSKYFVTLISAELLNVNILQYVSSTIKIQKFITIKFDNGQFDLNSFICEDLSTVSIPQICVLRMEYSNDYLDIYKLYTDEAQNVNNLSKRLFTALFALHTDIQPRHFIHGDLKISNILSSLAMDVKLFDLEGSCIANEYEIINNDTKPMIHAYLKMDGLVTREYLFIFDIFVLMFSAVHLVKHKFLSLLHTFRDHFKNTPEIHTNTSFMNAFVIINLLWEFKYDGKAYTVNNMAYGILDGDNCINATYNTINALFSKNLTFSNQLVNTHYVYMKEIINTCIHKNLVYDIVENILQELPINESTIDESTSERSRKISKIFSSGDVSTDSLTLSPDTMSSDDT
jgi:hypothetical protein